MTLFSTQLGFSPYDTTAHTTQHSTCHSSPHNGPCVEHSIQQSTSYAPAFHPRLHSAHFISNNRLLLVTLCTTQTTFLHRMCAVPLQGPLPTLKQTTPLKVQSAQVQFPIWRANLYLVKTDFQTGESNSIQGPFSYFFPLPLLLSPAFRIQIVYNALIFNVA
jgi:hypothetical protein